MKQRWTQLTTAAVLSVPSISQLVSLVSDVITTDSTSLLSSAEALHTPPRALLGIHSLTDGVGASESLLYWFTRKPLARVRLLLVNDMGGTATDFAQFDRLSPSEVEIVALNLPGHRGRPRSAYVTSMEALTEMFLREAAPQLGDKPLAIYGQCMGGHVAYEIVQALQKQPTYDISY